MAASNARVGCRARPPRPRLAAGWKNRMQSAKQRSVGTALVGLPIAALESVGTR